MDEKPWWGGRRVASLLASKGLKMRHGVKVKMYVKIRIKNHLENY